MKIRTKEELEDLLHKDLSWRKKEFTAISFMVQRASGDDKLILMRAAILLFYSHWEGHVKYSARIYLYYLSFKAFELKKLKSNFLQISLGEKFTGDGSIKKFKFQKIAYEFFKNSLEDNFCVNPDKIIDTESNLKFDVLLCILEQIGLEKYKEQISTKKNFIDQTLLKHRNSIAHGDFLYNGIVENAYDEIYKHLLEMITDFNDSIFKAIVEQDYLLPL